MIALFPLRPVQIVDVSFQLLRKKFVASFAVALCVTLPLQALLWLIEASQPQDTGPNGRITLIITIVQFFTIGAALTIVSNLNSKSTGRAYCKTIFNDLYTLHSSPSRALVGLYQVGIQLVFVGGLIMSRYFFGQLFLEKTADNLGWLLVGVMLFPWIFVTLRVGFAVPISVHEGGSFSNIRKRTRQINSVHFWKLFGVYCITLLMIVLLVFPSLAILEIFIANNFIKSDIGEIAFTNLVLAIVIASIATVYGYILTVTYFNARIENEGFDISVAIQQDIAEVEGRGKLLNSLT